MLVRNVLLLLFHSTEKIIYIYIQDLYNQLSRTFYVMNLRNA